MVLRVAKVDEVLVLTEDMTHALRVVELRLVVKTIYEANLAVSDLVLKLHGIFIYNDYTVVGCICDENEITIEASLLLNTDNLARIAEILTSSGTLFGSLADRIILSLGFLLYCFLFFRLPVDGTTMV